LENYIKCAVCGKEIKMSDTHLWVYHKSFPGPVCHHHHGVKEEYEKLLNKLKEDVKQFMPKD